VADPQATSKNLQFLPTGQIPTTQHGQKLQINASTNKQRLMWLLTFHKLAMCTASVRSRNAYQRAAHHEKNVSSEGRENHIRPSFVIIMD